ncbi:uncharacterized protein LOC142321170 [Lycorma delicatula]|uniref:uncharacterized protein LOC142321170 n=1 Tax=Lycorma delicatula TaxID=130591 RepID=UPI003F50D6EA
MKRGRLEAHLKAKHSVCINSDLNYFQTLKKIFEKRATLKSLFTDHAATASRTLEASYQMSLLVAKSGKKLYYRREFKPSISAFLKTVLEKDDKDVKAMPRSNHTVSRTIDKMSENIEKLTTRNFSVQIDE